MRFLDDAFPLIVTVSGPVFDAAEVRALADGFERYFARGERYAVLSTSPPSAPPPGQHERKMIAEWANHPRVRDFSKRLCVGSATVVHNAISRAALTVITSLWKPAAPLEVVPNVERGLDYCLRRIREERLPVSKPLDMMRYGLLAQLRDVI